VHVHPGRAFARARLGSAHGKTEAWIVLEADAGATMHAGLRPGAGPDALRAAMQAQDAGAMLDALHALPVAAGDAIFVPAGTPHAIGAGILLAELQEPTDFSVLLEWEGFELEADDGHLGLGWDVALAALDPERPAAERGPQAGARLLPEAADPYFRAERVAGGDTLDPGFSVLVVDSGTGDLAGLPVSRGDVVLLPWAAGPAALTGDAGAIRCRPPAPDAGAGPW
jgi:mannose-6-phosphate isomerase